MKTTAIAILAKTPSLSPAKTRLAVGVGREKANEFYLQALKVIQLVVSDVDASSYWAVNEEAGTKDQLWQGLYRFYSGSGGLGEKQSQTYDTLITSYDNVILVGTDVPQISPEVFNQAIKALETKDFVIGPASDGGYYLFGGRVPMDQKIWTHMTYSQDDVCEKLVASLPSVPAYVATLTDVDTQENLQAVLEEMPDKVNSAQGKMTQWIKKTI